MRQTKQNNWWSKCRYDRRLGLPGSREENKDETNLEFDPHIGFLSRPFQNDANLSFYLRLQAYNASIHPDSSAATPLLRTKDSGKWSCRRPYGLTNVRRQIQFGVEKKVTITSHLSKWNAGTMAERKYHMARLYARRARATWEVGRSAKQCEAVAYMISNVIEKLRVDDC